MMLRPILLAFAATLALAACNRGANDNAADANAADAALTNALGNQITVDANASTPAKPAGNDQASAQAGQATPGAVEKARVALKGADNNGCAGQSAKLEEGAGWADKLPAAFAVYPGAKVTEAAANNSNGCSVRIVSMTTSDDWQRVLDWYNTRAVRGGYSTEHRIEGSDHILGGTGRDGGAYYLIVTPGQGTTEINLIADKGR